MTAANPQGDSTATPPPTRGFFRSLRTRFVVAFSLLMIAVLAATVLVLIFGLPLTSYSGQRGHQRAEAFASLSLIADLKQERIDRLLERRRNNICVFADNKLVRDAVVELGEALDRLKASDASDDPWTPLRDEPSYRTLSDFLAKIEVAYGVCEAMHIVDAETGTILVSADLEFEGQTIAGHTPFVGALRSGQGYTSDIEICPVSGLRTLHLSHVIQPPGTPAGIQATPVGVMVLGLNPDEIIKPMLHTGEGLGARGEALLVNHNVRILTSLKHPLADGSRAVPLEHRITARPAILAAQGQEGVIETTDYRGVPVLAAYRHIKVGPDVGWGLVVKQDRAELFSPLYQGMAFAAVIGVVGILAVIALTIIMAGILTRPMLSLSRAAEAVSEGRLDTRAPVVTHDEVGSLAATFNAMVERIQRWHAELEEQVAARTAELSDTNEVLENEIVERRRAEHGLRESSRRLVLAVQSAELGLWDWHVQTGDVVYDERWARMLGYSLDELKPDISTWEELLHPEDKPFAMADLSRHFEGATPFYQSEFRLRTRAGGWHWVLSCGRVFERDDQGKPVRMVGTHLSIDERRCAEEALRESEIRFRSIVETTCDWVWEINREGHHTYSNEGVRAILGYRPGEFLELDTFNLIHEEDRQEVAETLPRLVADKRGWAGWVIRWRHKNGEHRYLDSSAVPMLDAQGELIGFRGTDHDITDRKRAQEALANWSAELERANAELRLRNTELDEFTYVASHDLQEPLRKLTAFSDLLQKDIGDLALPDAAAKDLSFIIDSARRMQTLVRDLLALSRAGRADIETKRVSLAECVDRAIGTLTPRIENAGAKIIRDELPAMLGDWTMLTQLYQNLIGNALKFIGDAPPVVHVTVESTQDGPVFGVKDNGIGIKPEYAEQIFAPFRRLHPHGRYEGSGIGLAICRKAVERHGGRIWVESMPGEGAHFRFTLNQAEGEGQ